MINENKIREACASNRERGFKMLMDSFQVPIYNYIRRLVVSHEDAEDVLQEVFIRVFRHIDQFREESSLSTWIYRIAYNTAISELRRKRQEFVAIEESQISNVSEEEVSEMLGRTSATEQLDKLEAALELLPPDERALILLFYMKEKTVEELTVITGLGTSNIKVKLHRIRKKLFVLIKGMEEN